ncbi:IS3 family transposase [Streptomyces sp. YH02]|uniref:IS3 family transposase n=1 Tax=Streptomyces sp. YH02 TaxID=3256999 RepID=UPI0037562D4E
MPGHPLHRTSRPGRRRGLGRLEGRFIRQRSREAFNSLFKAELIRNKGPWTGINDVEIAVAEYVEWFNQRRLHGDLDHVPPTEFEALHSTPAMW